MREILFKAKRIDNGEWVEGSYVQYNHCPHSSICTNLDVGGDGYHEPKYQIVSDEVDPATLSQYTGLTDKNGVKIFEGDIVRFQLDNDDCPFPNKRIEKIIGKVFYSEWRASFSVTMGKSLSDIVNNNLYEYIRGGNRVEVIGSIHDTPELTNQAATPHADQIEAGTRRGENI